MTTAPRNPGIPFDSELLRAPDFPPAEFEAPATEENLLAVVRAIDLTTLAGDDTPQRVTKLCAAARRPIPGWDVTVAAVCVHPAYIALAKRELAGSGVPVATAAASFPHGLGLLRNRTDEVRACAEEGADEIDVVIRRSHALLGEWEALYDEVRGFREAAGGARLKTILATSELAEAERIYRAGATCLTAGADFIKTSTGKEVVNATLEAGAVMAAAIRAYGGRTGFRAGLKPAGGIRHAGTALSWLALVRDTLGADRTGPETFRIGASGLLDDVRARLSEAP